MNCTHYFGRTIKSLEGVPYDYEYGCMENHDLSKCGDRCPFRDPKVYTPTSGSSSIADDLRRYLDNAREKGVDVHRVLIPYNCYDMLTEEQIRWAEENYKCVLVRVERKQSSSSTHTKKVAPKTTSPKEYGMKLKRKRYGKRI